ncbi:L,D-transpeptidase [Methylobacterium terricola]|uniref:L,D-transpeptidase n=1 Tax=Methylobacterium terricola TaxID=2583531 RepID=A0A5C4LL88_9HYPH|nr:L,D-transpeptidase [Methylobacterium terricola]TNC15276.1 L,D-transpeptidase [Methylobacterium terricola]
MQRRRLALAFVLTGAVLALPGCLYRATPDPDLSAKDKEWMAMVPEPEIDRRFARYLIEDPTGEAPGTIVVETKERQLYYVLPDRKAIRYGVTVGDEAYGWSGTARLFRKAVWPDWHPPAEMIKRWPHVHAMQGGPANPLGARALYLADGTGKDTLYRIHGTNEPERIGQAASSGCIRMRNIDVVDLYNRVGTDATVIVR